jgi:hypothetical protein
MEASLPVLYPLVQKSLQLLKETPLQPRGGDDVLSSIVGFRDKEIGHGWPTTGPSCLEVEPHQETAAPSLKPAQLPTMKSVCEEMRRVSLRLALAKQHLACTGLGDPFRDASC